MGLQARACNIGIGPHRAEPGSQDGGIEEGGVEEGCTEEDGVEAGAHLIVASRGSLTMAGAIVLVLILVGFPVIVGLGSVVLAALLGTSLDRDAVKRHAGSELLDLNR